MHLYVRPAERRSQRSPDVFVIFSDLSLALNLMLFIVFLGIACGVYSGNLIFVVVH